MEGGLFACLAWGLGWDLCGLGIGASSRVCDLTARMRRMGVAFWLALGVRQVTGHKIYDCLSHSFIWVTRANPADVSRHVNYAAAAAAGPFPACPVSNTAACEALVVARASRLDIVARQRGDNSLLLRN